MSAGESMKTAGENMTRIIYVRHGETNWNIERRYQGQTDIPLNEKGLQQAEWVAERLAGEKVAAIYASDLTRAFVTAQTIAKRHGLEVIPMPAFREISFGDWEGSSFNGLDNDAKAQIDKIFTDPEHIKVPGGENFQQVQARTNEGIAELLEKHPNETIIVVTHGAAIRTILCSALNLSLASVWHIRQDNTAVNQIAYYPGDHAIVELMNDAHHLR